MSDTDQSLTDQYADRIAQNIRDNVDHGAPFGWYDEESDTLYTDRDEVPRMDADDFDPDDVPDYDASDVLTAPLVESVRAAYGSEYLSDVLDFRYVVGTDRGYLNGEVCIGLGGPNVWITTDDRSVTVYWGGKATRSLPSAFIDGLNEALSEIWEMGA